METATIELNKEDWDFIVDVLNYVRKASVGEKTYRKAEKLAEQIEELVEVQIEKVGA